MGIAYEFDDSTPPSEPRLPRIIIKRPRPGHIHALEKSDVRQILNFVGPEALYGLRSVELVQRPSGGAAQALSFGRLIVPGRIKLFELPTPPWRLPGMLPAGEAEKMRLAGAEVTLANDVQATFVDWPADSLRDYVAFEVLLHEIGHHILQHNLGKRTERVVRTRDHEAFAARFVARHRAAWYGEERLP